MNPRRLAFVNYVHNMRTEYHRRKPGRDERSFIWSFIEGMPDKDCVQWVQLHLLERLPGKAWQRKTPRYGRIITISRDLKWTEVKMALSSRSMPPFLK